MATRCASAEDRQEHPNIKTAVALFAYPKKISCTDIGFSIANEPRGDGLMIPSVRAAAIYQYIGLWQEQIEPLCR